MKESIFNQLNALNVNGHTEKKGQLTYLSWAWAWAEVCKLFPDATYTVKHWGDAPYFEDEKLGIICETEVTINGKSLAMWLPVLDGANRALKSTAYTVKTNRGEVTVNPATMYEVNKTIMRCLVKNLAMFGLGLYIYAGEDAPEVDKEAEEERAQNAADMLRGCTTVEELKATYEALAPELKVNLRALCIAVGNELKKNK